MGEWSKTIGEFGEETVENFLKIIGWGKAPRNITVECIKPKLHGGDNENRQTHGIDFYFSYLSPLSDNTLKNIHISSKYTFGVYPNSPARLFKEYVQELAWTVECFKNAQKKSEYNSALKGYKRVEDVGVLFWLTNNEGSYDDLAIKLATANINLEGPIQNIYLVDNKRISFIIQAYRYAENYYKDYTIDFFYPNTGKNIIPMQKKDYGKMLPVEYINGSVLLIRVQDSYRKTGLILFSIDPFSKTDLARLIGLSQDLSKSWSAFINISFPDYDRLLHDPDVRQIKADFHNDFFVENLMVSSYSNTFKSINE